MISLRSATTSLTGKYKPLCSILQEDQILSPTFQGDGPIIAPMCERVIHVAWFLFQLSSAPLSLALWLHVLEATKIVLSSGAAGLRHIDASKTKPVTRGLRIGQCFSPNPLALARNDPRTTCTQHCSLVHLGSCAFVEPSHNMYSWRYRAMSCKQQSAPIVAGHVLDRSSIYMHQLSCYWHPFVHGYPHPNCA